MDNDQKKSKLHLREFFYLRPSSRTWLCCWALLWIFVLSSCKRTSLPEGVIAQVNDEYIAVEEFSHELSGQLVGTGVENPVSQPRSAQGYPALKGKILQQLIEQHLLLQEIKLQQITIDPQRLQNHVEEIRNNFSPSEFSRFLKDLGIDETIWVKNEERRLLIEELYQKEITEKVNISQDAIKSYYDAHESEFMMSEQVHVSQIVVGTEGEAHNILQALRSKKGTNFAELAKKFSLSPDAVAGGDIGFYSKGEMPAVFDGCFDLNPGGLSQVVPSEYGFHIFKLLEKRGARQQSLEEVADKIRNNMRQEAEERFYRNWVQGLQSKARIVRNEKLLQKL